MQGAGPTAAGYFLGGAIAFGGTEILKRTAIAVLGPQVAIAYSFPVSQSANKSVSQSVRLLVGSFLVVSLIHRFVMH